MVITLKLTILTLNLLIIYIQCLCQPAYVESDQTLVCTGGRQVVNTYIFELRPVCFDNNQRTSSSLTYSPYTISKLRGLLKDQ